jgi:hypothetical protein
MTTIEKLQAIRARCVELLATYPPCESTAGWRSTIAAIDLILKIGWTEGEICKEILTAWEGQL